MGRRRNKLNKNKKRAGNNSGSSFFREQNTEIPIEFREKMLREFGESGRKIVEAMDSSPPVSIRLNPKYGLNLEQIYEILAKSLGDTKLRAIPWCDTGYYLSFRPDFTLDPIHHSGLYYVQEAASMLVGVYASKLASRSKENILWLDMCAAPGGKATHIARSISGKGIVVANEYDTKRIRSLIDNVVRMGCENVIVTRADGKDFGKLSGLFDGCSIDAPCSGEGMFRKDKKSRSDWSNQKVNKCAVIQAELIKSAEQCVVKKGQIIYSTCTFSSEENEEHFGNHNSDWWELKEDHVYKSELRFAPGITESEGFYINNYTNNENKTLSKYDSIKLHKKEPPAFIDKEAIQSRKDIFLEINNKVFLVSQEQYKLAEILTGNEIRIQHIGIQVGEITNGRTIPSHNLITSDLYKTLTNFPVINVENHAEEYLRGEALMYSEGLSTGYCVISHKNIPLGLGKISGHRINNLYPKYLRIKKKKLA